MALTFRLATQADFPSFARIADDGFEDAPQLKLTLPKVWGGWRHSGSLIMAVVEDDELPPPKLVAYAATVFLANEFVDQALRNPTPHLAIQVVERELQGRSPVLRLDAIRHANATNKLNLHIIHYTEHFQPLYPDEAKRETRNKMIKGLIDTHSGFGLFQIIHEFCGEDVLPYSLASGMNLRTDYADYFARLGALPASPRRPYLVGLTREEAKRTWGKTLSLLFDSPSPQFNFSLLQQDVLWIALFERDNDAWIARRLGVEPEALKKRWGTIVSSIEKVKPNFFPGRRNDDREDQPRRGPEKRRFVLEYLRQHVEELHPFQAGPHRRRSHSAGD